MSGYAGREYEPSGVSQARGYASAREVREAFARARRSWERVGWETHDLPCSECGSVVVRYREPREGLNRWTCTNYGACEMSVG